MRPIVTDRVAWSVSLSVRRSVILVSPAKTAAPIEIEMPFRLRTQVRPKNHVLDGRPDHSMGRGNFEGGRGVLLYSDTLRSSVQKRLNRSRCRLGYGLGWAVVIVLDGCPEMLLLDSRGGFSGSSYLSDEDIAYFDVLRDIAMATIFTARAMARNARIASAVLAIAIPSVRLSVCLSVTRRYCVKTTARSTVQFAPLDRKMCLVL